MKYTELKKFLTLRMRMSQIYQPLMIRFLLEKSGQASDESIASEILKYDPSQTEYYRKIVNNMVGRVLKKHKIVINRVIMNIS